MQYKFYFRLSVNLDHEYSGGTIEEALSFYWMSVIASVTCSSPAVNES